MTERLYYTDSYLREFSAQIVDRSEDGFIVYLDRTAFYPTSGGQPSDRGAITGVAVVDVIDETDRIAHRLARPVAAGSVDCSIDWSRRFDHMQQHSGQHLLSAVFEELFHLKTISFHLGAESATIDIEGGAVDSRSVIEAERRANQIVAENRPLTVSFEHVADVEGLRRASEREGTLRIVSIQFLDRSACGGTHVRATGEIGAILLRKLEKVRKSTRVEFLCGARAIRRARADYDALAKAAQQFSGSLDDVPTAVSALLESARAGEKTRRRLKNDLARHQGKELYDASTPGPDGFRRVTKRLEHGTLDEVRAIAQSFTAYPKAIFVGTLADPPSVLVATSADSGLDAGETLQAALSAAGGRGGGSPRMAQGTVASATLLDQVLAQL